MRAGPSPRRGRTGEGNTSAGLRAGGTNSRGSGGGRTWRATPGSVDGPYGYRPIMTNGGRFSQKDFDLGVSIARIGLPPVFADSVLLRRRVLRLRGIVLRVRRRHLGADRLPPGVQAVAETVGQFRLVLGQVVLFADVLLDVIQLDVHVVEELDELEVAGPDRAVRHRAALLVVLVVGIVPEQLGADGPVRSA